MTLGISVLNAADSDTTKVYSRLKKYSEFHSGWTKKLRVNNSGQRLDSNITAEWVNDSWQPYEKEEFIYDTEKRLVLVYNYSQDQSSEDWVLQAKSEIDYFSSLTRTLYYDWDNDLKEFSESYLLEASFNEQGQKTKEIFSYYDETDWVNEEKIEYTYYQDGTLMEEIQYYYDIDLWLEEEKTELTYHSGTLVKSEINYEYDGIWYPVFKENYIFNGGLPVARQSYDYEGPEVDSFLVEETTFLYDIKENPETEIFSGDWGEEKIEYMYDLSYELAALTTPGNSLFIPQINSQILNKPLGYMSYYSGTSGWEPNKRELYFYSEDIITSTDKRMKSSFILYPNPAKDFTFINSETAEIGLLKVIDMSGHKIIHEAYQSGEMIPTSHLKPGIYTLLFQSPFTLITEKLIIE